MILKKSTIEKTMHPYITKWPYNKEKVICFTWDDANYTHAYMALIFKWFGIRETHFLNTQQLPLHYGFYHYLYNIIKPLGIDIGSHTQNHVVVTEIDEETLRKELVNSKKDIIDHFGIVPSTFSHPTSSYDISTDKIIQEYFLDSRYSIEKESDTRYEFMRVRRKYTPEFYKNELDKFDASNKEIYIYGGHGLDGYGYEPMSWKTLWSILRYVKTKFSNRYWVPTFSELSMFIRIRELGVKLIEKEDCILIDKSHVQKILNKYPNTPALITVMIDSTKTKTIDLQRTNKIEI